MTKIEVLVDATIVLAVAGIILLVVALTRNKGFVLIQVDLSKFRMTGVDLLDFKNYAKEFFRDDPELLKHSSSHIEAMEYMRDCVYPRLTTSFSVQTGRGVQIKDLDEFVEDLFKDLQGPGMNGSGT